MNINYKIIRSNRKTISIQISPINEVTVRAPQKLTIAEIEKFIKSKQGWINKKCTANEQTLCEKNDVLSFKKIYVCGKLLPLELGTENKIMPEKVYLKNINQIKHVLMEFVSPLFLLEYEKISSSCNLKSRTVSFKSYKARWGCCDGNNNIVFNYKLLMLPIESWRYVIIHELCHTKYHNHSKAFWQLVFKYCKNYKYERSFLKRFSFIASAY